MDRPSQHLLRFFDVNLPQTIVSKPSRVTNGALKIALAMLALLAACATSRQEPAYCSKHPWLDGAWEKRESDALNEPSTGIPACQPECSSCVELYSKGYSFGLDAAAKHKCAALRCSAMFPSAYSENSQSSRSLHESLIDSCVKAQEFRPEPCDKAAIKQLEDAAAERMRDIEREVDRCRDQVMRENPGKDESTIHLAISECVEDQNR